MNLKDHLLLRLAACVVLVQLSPSPSVAAYLDLGNPDQGSATSVAADTLPDVGSTGSVDGYGAIPPITPLQDTDYLPLIFKAWRSGDWTEAEILETKLTDPAARALAEWFAIRGAIPLGFDRIMAFGKNYPDWPESSLLRRRAEDALVAGHRAPAEVRAFFQKAEPLTAAGRIALAFANKAAGLDAEANAQIRAVWREDSFGSDMEGRILERFPDTLAQADHRFRMERQLFKEHWSAALRAAGYAGEDYDKLVEARRGIYQGKRKAEKAFAAVPAALRKDLSYVFSRALYLRRTGRLAEAAQAMTVAPRNPELLVDGDEWWAERRRIASGLLDEGDARAAYQVASQAAPESAAARIEAAFYAGWIALRFLNDPVTAGRHFAAAEQPASTPISMARAAYWRARAAEAAGSKSDAAIFYKRAADLPTTYYGQLAMAKIGQPVALRAVEPLSREDRATFDRLIPVQALKLLQQVDEPELTLRLYTELAQDLDDPGQLDALASLAAESGNARATLIVGKLASQRGFPLDRHAYPLFAIPDFEPIDDVDPAMVYAIARQESAFNSKAVSSAGARGLMQLMPATAKETAERFGVGYDFDRLTSDPAYNARLGSAHLGRLLDSWKGSPILAFASYNAGPGNVRKWVSTYGDPRDPKVDTVDWIERIPFGETRNYVQRVLENLTVYRQRLRGRSGHPGNVAAGAAEARD